MAKKGVKKIQGQTRPAIGIPAIYKVTHWYPGTPESQKDQVKWELLKKRSNGTYTTTKIIKIGRSCSFTFGQRSVNEQFKIVAYMYSPETTGGSILAINPVNGPAQITGISIFDSTGKIPTEPPKYGQKIILAVDTVNMIGEDVTLSLWERDTVNSTTHDTKENTLLWKQPVTVENTNGRIRHTLVLTPDFAEKSHKNITEVFDAKTHEYYLIAQSKQFNTSYISKQQDIKNITVQVKGVQTTPPPKNSKSPVVVGEKIKRKNTKGYWNIYVSSKEDRVKNPFGVAVLEDDKGIEIFKFKVRLQGLKAIKVKGNKTKRKTSKGDTPLGAYGLGGAANKNDYSLSTKTSTYGKYPRMLMAEGSKYTSGEIKTTGRSLIRLHGGRQNPKSMYGNIPLLRPTIGCIRAYDFDMKKLNEEIKKLMKDKKLYPGHVVVSNDLTNAIFQHKATINDADGNTNLRSSNKSNSKVIAKIPNGTEVELLDYDDINASYYSYNRVYKGKLKVRYKGKIGYIYSQNLKNFKSKVLSYTYDSSKTTKIEKPKPKR